MADQQQPVAEKAKIPITEVSDNHRKIPKSIFLDNVEAWVDKYGDDELFAEMNELYQKYKFMETQMLRARQNFKVKLPDIKRTLEMVAMLKQRSMNDEKQLETNFLLSDKIWAKATIPNDTGKVGLCLGANVMVEYSYDDALKLLAKNLAQAQAKLAETEDDVNFLKDQITTTEVNMARVYNQGVHNKQKKEGTVWTSQLL